MRIVMTVSNPFKPDPRVYKEAKSLAKHGHEVIVIAWDREGKYPKEEVIDCIKIIRFGPKSKYGNLLDFALKLPLFYLRTLKFILRHDYDAIHTHDFDTAILGLLAKILRRKKWIYDVHDLYYTFFSMEGEKENFLEKLIQRLDMFLAKSSNVVIVATQSIGGKYEGLREYYIKSGINPEKIVTIWNVPEVESFLKHEELNLKKPKKFTIGFIGSQRTISNFIRLFEAVKNEKNSKILFVGTGKVAEELKRTVKEKYRNLDIEFIGSVPYKLIPNYYKLCNVMYAYYPPRENVKRAIAIKVFEAAILGIPVIVNADSLMEDFVKKYRCGATISTPTVNDVQRALEDVKLVKFSPKYIRRKWNWRNEERKLIRTYHRVARR
ncbi:Glycosyl transferase, group 1 [Thermococcus sp. 2319x1]|uniref:glycosyltransferase family 4 protein n=1 Tax=Thermococcus sp. 2319x1 TaxID=1674923 RepID=UPI00073AA8B1|nr:glycosyltransferase family 4 protein [Thermococcus sp. 2319x1]ALV63887.1 Glycosyl transferase, group 1 [Thermococcus sp. 2319x1]